MSEEEEGAVFCLNMFVSQVVVGQLTQRWQTVVTCPAVTWGRAPEAERVVNEDVFVLASFENKPDQLSRQEVVCRLLVRFCCLTEEDWCLTLSCSFDICSRHLSEAWRSLTERRLHSTCCSQSLIWMWRGIYSVHLFICSFYMMNNFYFWNDLVHSVWNLPRQV